MLQYTIKRLLLIPPTFFFVSLVIFLVLNIAPGRPGETDIAAQAGEKSDSANQQESFRIFKEQFNLDKPILLNWRFTLSQEDVRTLVVDANNLFNETESQDRLSAQEDLDDYGNYLVRHLISILKGDKDPEVRRLAAIYLVRASQRRFLSERRADDIEAVR